jgi:hypothetical protein
MVWCGGRKGRRGSRAGRKFAHDAVNFGGFQGFFKAQRRQDGGQALGQHGLAGARRAHHEDVVTPRRGQKEGPFDRLLAFDFAEVQVIQGLPGRGLHRRGRFGRERLPAGQEVHHLGQGLDGIDLQPGHHPGFSGVLPGDDEGETSLPGGQGYGEDSPGGLQAAIQGELAEQEILVQGLLGHNALGNEDPQRYGKVEARALFPGVRGREVQGDAITRELITRRFHRGPNPVFGLLDRGVGQPHGGESRQPRRQENLHLHDVGVHAAQSAAFNLG